MDGPSVNLKFLQSLCNLRESEGLSGLIDIGVCQLYVMHGVFQTGAVKSTWNIPKILKAVWQIFHDSPAQRDDYISVTDSTSFSHHFCATIWVESEGVAERAKLEIFGRSYQNRNNLCDSYNTVKDAVDDPVTVAKSGFFIYVAGL